MTHFYLLYYPKARQAMVKTMGIVHRRVIIYKKEDELDEVFKERAIAEFNEYFEKQIEVIPENYRNGELLTTKTIS